jgi:hypothetical protein
VKNPLFSWKKVPTVHGHIPMLEHMKKPDLWWNPHFFAQKFTRSDRWNPVPYPMTGMTGLFHSYPTWPPIWSPVEPEPCDATRRVDPSAEFSAVSNARNVVAMFISNWWYTYPSETIKQCHKPSSSPFLWVVSINHSQSWMVYDIVLTTLIIIVITIN